MARRLSSTNLLRELLVVIPHSGIMVPAEIAPDSLAEEFPALLENVDWYTNWLYDFSDLLDNHCEVFPYCSLLLEANRHPDVLGDSVPLKDVFGREVYRAGCEPTWEERLNLANRYLRPFHRRITTTIGSGCEFLLDAHSTIVARGVGARQIDLMNYQFSELDPEPKYYSPAAYIESYAAELSRRLPDVEVTVNASEYWQVYGHVCAEHGIDAMGRVGNRVPAICQETCQSLYMNGDGTPDVMAIDHLRRIFAEAIYATLARLRSLRRPPGMLQLHNLRQTFDFDCGVKALQGVMAYYGVEEREDRLLDELRSDRVNGTSVTALVAAAERRGFEVEAGTNWTLDQVKRNLDEGRPVIVLIQAWAERYLSLRQWRSNYDDGHYVVLIGYDGPVLYFEDPASFHRTWLRENEFMARWHDRDPRTREKLLQVGMVLHGREPVGEEVKQMG